MFVLFESSFDDFQDMCDSQTFWHYLVSFGYQAGVTEDGDPKRGPWIESPLLGGPPKSETLNARFSAIFVEAVRELWEYGNAARVPSGPGQNLPMARDNCWNLIAGDTAHETVHAPGGHDEDADHNEGGVLLEGVVDLEPYSPLTVKRFRTATSRSP